jgi:hypothetical protein
MADIFSQPLSGYSPTALFVDDVLNKNELQSVSAVIAYVAYTQNANEETVRQITIAAFGVGDIAVMSQNNYDEIIRFLINLRVDEVLN